MKFVYIDKGEFETDIIADILGSENICFKTKEHHRYIPLVFSVCDLKSYDISFDTSYQKYLFVDKLIKDKLKDYKQLEKCFILPSYDKYKIIEPQTALGEAIEDLKKSRERLITDMNKLPKSSLLYRLSRWINKW